MIINASYDSTLSSAPAGFQTAVQAAINFFQTTFTNNITLNITFSWSALSGGAIAQSSSFGYNFSYSSVVSALTAADAGQSRLTGFKPPSSNPFSAIGSTLFVTTAEAKALGMSSYSGSDGTCTLNSSNLFNFNPATASVTGEYNAVSALEHEISEVMGRQCGGDGSLTPTPLALTRYSAPGVIDTSSSYAGAYFSVDGGVTNLMAMGEQGADLADWASGVRNDPFGYATLGQPSTISSADITALNALGYHLQSYNTSVIATARANDLTYAGSASGYNHFIDILNFVASYPDLIAAFGSDQTAANNWFTAREAVERRVETFDGLDYIASYADLIKAFAPAGSMQSVMDVGASHFIASGSHEGRTTSFNGLDYIASYGDLIKAFGANSDNGAYHYIEHGNAEFRSVSFDGLNYIASYTDLIRAFGANEQAGAAHFIKNGFSEGRVTTFDGLAYIAQYTDLMTAFGANNDAGAAHYIAHGLGEGRGSAFNVTAYQQAHTDLIGKFASNDAFLAAYINYYNATGTYLT